MMKTITKKLKMILVPGTFPLTKCFISPSGWGLLSALPSTASNAHNPSWTCFWLPWLIGLLSLTREQQR